ncbi:MAG: hypothetical protein FJZ87_00755 [Chloroflexi bacterium]|nr:hypothetical protein [Chloroflexota bacterium]
MSPLLKRVVFSLLAGLAISAAVSEVSFLFLREDSRSPKVFQLVIPAGTADGIARGEKPPTLPEEMRFVVGDVLSIKNEDTVPHELGPLFIPAGSSTQLSFNAEENYSYSCSFQPDNQFGLTVVEPVTLYTRVVGILFAGLPLGGLIALYSLAAYPIKSRVAKV